MKIFISSTSYDLKDYREAVIGALQHAGETPVCMEHIGAAVGRPLDKCMQMVKDADAYVGIFARRYGYVPHGRSRSMTHIEYEEARKLNKPRFIFLLDESADWPRGYEDVGPQAERAKRLRSKLQAEHWPEEFPASADKLASIVLAAIHREYSPPDPKVLKALLNPSPQDIDRVNEEVKRHRDEIVGPTVLMPVSEHFKDRDAERARLHQCLSDPSIRAVIVCGRAGTGKTELVKKLIEEAREAAAGPSVSGIPQIEGVAFVSLGDADSRSPEVIVELVSRELGSESGQQVRASWQAEGVPLRERIRRLLADTLTKHRCIIVLDNLESVLDQGNRIKDEHAGLRLFVDELLLHEHCALLIATSRCELAMSSDDIEAKVFGRKTLVPLDQGLPLPDAVALLRESDPDGKLGIRDAQEDALKHLAERCGCIPRTLLSVIGTMRSREETLDTLLADEYTLASIIERPERELYASLQTSQEQYVVQTIAVCQQFEDSVPAVAVGHMLPALRVGDVMHRLVVNHVISFSPASRRYSLHPAFLQYAYDQIRCGVGDPHLHRMHGLAAGFYEKLRKDESEWKCIEDLEPQLRQIRHLIRAESYDDACGVLNEIDREYLGLWRYSRLVIELREQMLNKIADHYLATLNLANLAVAYYERSEPEDSAKALELYDVVIPQFHDLGKREQEGRFIGNKGVLMDGQGDALCGEKLLVEALAIARETGDRLHQCRWLGALAYLRYRHGRSSVEEVTRDLEESVRIATEIEPPDRRFEELWSHNLGQILANSDRLGDAVNWLERAAKVARDIRDTRAECFTRLELQVLYNRLGKPEEASRCLDIVKARTVEVRKLDDKRDILLWIGDVYGEKGEKKQQIDYYEQALSRAEELEDLQSRYRIYASLAELYRSEDMHDKVAAMWEHVAAAAKEANDPIEMATASMSYGDAMARLHKIGEAIKSYEEALRLAQEHGNRTVEIDAAYRLATALRSINDAERALKYYGIALPLVKELGNLYGQIRILNDMGIAYYNLSKFKEAIPCYQESLEAAIAAVDADSIAVAQFNTGDAFLADGNPAAAIPYLEKALEAESNFRYKVAEGLGMAYMEISQPENARPHFEMCISICEQENAVANSLCPFVAAKAVSLLALGESEKALEAYRTGLADLVTPELVKYALSDLNVLRRSPCEITGLADAIRLLKQKLEDVQFPSA